MSGYRIPPEVFDRAAEEVLRPGGWIQNAMGCFADDDGPVCALGAISRALRILNVAAHICDPISPGFSIMDWYGYASHVFARANNNVAPDIFNDDKSRTVQQVADSLSRTADYIREVNHASSELVS